MSLPTYPDYKDSGVAWIGRLPMHWDVLSARRLFDECRDAASPEDEQLSATQRYGVIPQRLFMEAEDQKVVLALAGTSNFKRVRKDDFVISLRSFQGGIEHSNYEGCVSPAYTVLRPSRAVASKYWSYMLKSAPYISALQTVTAGIRDGKNISYGQFGGLEVPVPPLEEQRAIAHLLDRETAKIDALIAEQEKLLALLAEKRQATISHAVTRGLDPNAPMKESGIPWLGEVPAAWDLPPLYMRYSSELGKMLDTDRITGRYLVPYLRNVDVQWDAINYANLPAMDIKPDEIARYTVRDGDLLVCEGGEVGRAAVVNVGDSVIGYQKALHRLRALSEAECPRYMFYIFSWASKAGAFAGEGQATIAHLTGEQLRRYRFPRPSKVEQEAIAEFLDGALAKLAKLSEEAESGIALLKERRNALIAAAVTGQMDVRDTSTA